MAGGKDKNFGTFMQIPGSNCLDEKSSEVSQDHTRISLSSLTAVVSTLPRSVLFLVKPYDLIRFNWVSYLATRDN